MHLDGPVVLGSESIAEDRSLGFAASKTFGNDYGDNDEDRCRNNELRIRELMKHFFSWAGFP